MRLFYSFPKIIILFVLLVSDPVFPTVITLNSKKTIEFVTAPTPINLSPLSITNCGSYAGTGTVTFTIGSTAPNAMVTLNFNGSIPIGTTTVPYTIKRTVTGSRESKNNVTNVTTTSGTAFEIGKNGNDGTPVSITLTVTAIANHNICASFDTAILTDIADDLTITLSE